MLSKLRCGPLCRSRVKQVWAALLAVTTACRLKSQSAAAHGVWSESWLLVGCVLVPALPQARPTLRPQLPACRRCVCGGMATWLLLLLFLVVFAEVGLAVVVVVVVDVVIVCGLWCQVWSELGTVRMVIGSQTLCCCWLSAHAFQWLWLACLSTDGALVCS